jgi:hypothetical protein
VIAVLVFFWPEIPNFQMPADHRFVRGSGSVLKLVALP